MEEQQKKSSATLGFLIDILRGIGIGVAFIIPGFSGGSVAAILGIYERLITAIADVFKDFKNSLKTLIPIGLGMVIGAVALLFPLKWALGSFPIPTVSLFVGLALGGIPSITDKLKRERISCSNVIAFIIPVAVVLSVAFMPIGTEKALLDLSLGGYALLFLIGVIGSAALVIPGISGSMLLLILGYYNPIVAIFTDHLLRGQDVMRSILVLGVTALGIAFGFLLISKIMKKLFAICPRGTYFAILGFIIGSVPTIFISTANEAGMSLSTLPTSALHWIFCVILLIFGFSLSYAIIIYTRSQQKDE